LVDNRSDSTKMHGATIRFIINVLLLTDTSLHIYILNVCNSFCYMADIAFTVMLRYAALWFFAFVIHRFSYLVNKRKRIKRNPKLLECILEVLIKDKTVTLQAWTGPEGSRKLRCPYFPKTTQDGGKVVSLTHRPPLTTPPPRKYSWYSFLLEAESTPGP